MAIAQKSSSITFGIGARYLDPFTLKYSWFGAIWGYTKSTKKIYGFWFGEHKTDIITLAQRTGWTDWIESTNPNELQDVYDTIRKKQKLADWNKTSLLSFKTAYVWKNTASGWYLIRSTPFYPFYISAIRKNYCFVWLKHADICENSYDLQMFIEKVNKQHQIELQLNV